MKTYVWQYWESDTPAPPYVRLCLETVARHLGGAEHVVLDEHSVEGRLPDLDPSWRRLAEAAHRADYVRSRLLERYGGIWLDADAVVLKDLSRLYTEDVSDADLLCWVNVSRAGCSQPARGAPRFTSDRGLGRGSRPHTRRGEQVFGSDSGLMVRPWFRLDHAVRSAWEHAISRPGASCTDLLARRPRLTRPARLALEGVLALQPDLVMLYNKMLQPRLMSVSAAELLSGETLLAAILRIGLAESTAEVRRSSRLGARVRALLHRRA
jgi:hypothetical protein